MSKHRNKHPPHQKHQLSKKKRHFCIKIVTWGLVSAAFTAVVSYFTRGYWEPTQNLHFIEFATCAMTLLEDA
jgi:hypothetical protein